jgi:hypothetical protein
VDDLKRRRLNMRNASPYADITDTTPRDYIKARAFSRLLERVGGMRSQQALNVQPFTGFQHRITKAQRDAAVARRNAWKLANVPDQYETLEEQAERLSRKNGA